MKHQVKNNHLQLVTIIHKNGSTLKNYYNTETKLTRVRLKFSCKKDITHEGKIYTLFFFQD